MPQAQVLDYFEKRQPVHPEPADYVLSDGEPDRAEDIIEPDGWELGEFDPIALFNHNRDLIIGKWSNVRVENKQLRGRLELAEPGTSPAVDMTRSLVAQGLLETVSVGFKSIEAEPINPKDPWGPIHFRKQELIEASLVSIPANPRARRIMKEYLSDDQLTRIFAGSAGNQPSNHQRPTRETTKMTVPQISTQGAQPLTNGQRIEINEARLLQLRGELTALSGEMGETLTDEQTQRAETLGAEIERTLRTLTTLKTMESNMVKQVAVAAPAPAAQPSAQVHAPAIIRQPVKQLRQSDRWFRGVTAEVIARAYSKNGKHIGSADVLAERYGKDELSEITLKAAIQPGSTTVAGWASELVTTTQTDFLDQLQPLAVFPTLSGKGPRFTFGRNGIIKIPGRSATPKINGSFVGEGQPIPVRRIGTTSISLTPKKMAVISEFTRELEMSSTPAIEALIRQSINEDTAGAIDAALLDAVAADTVRPAGLRNGVAGLTPSAAATTADKAIADIKALLAAITGAGGGRDLVIMMNPQQAQTLNWLMVNGIFIFPEIQQNQLRGISLIVSQNVTATMLIAVDAADFASVSGDVPEFDVSDLATVHEEDTSPQPISATGTPNTVAAPVRSFWQTYSVGIRMVLPMNWAMRRTGMVAWMTGVTW